MHPTILTFSLLLIHSLTFSFPVMDPPKSGVYETVRKQGKKLYEKADYKNASLMYQRYYKKYPDQHIAGILADCYWNLGWYDSAFLFLQKADQNVVLNKERQAEILARRGKYDEASLIYQSLMNASSSKKEFYAMKKSGYDQLPLFMRDSMNWKLEYLAVNSQAHEFAPTLSKGNLYIVTNRNGGYAYPSGKTILPDEFQFVHTAGGIKDLNTRAVINTTYNYYDFNRAYLSDITVRTSNDSKALLPGIVRKKMPFHGSFLEGIGLNGIVGRVSFSADGKDVYYSKIKRSSSGKDILVVCKSVVGNYLWKEEEVLSFNNDSSSAFHPFIAEDGKVLYFSSDRQGGKGGYDIYRSTLGEDGKWGAAENMSNVNTSNDEIYPSLYKDQFYFSSNGWPGLGGMDIFTAISGAPKNLGYPVNSSSDDYSIVFLDSSKGFMASNRYGSDDIFQLTYQQKNVQIKSFVVSNKTGLRLQGATVVLEQKQEDGSWKMISSSVTDHTGTYSFNVHPNRDDYRVRISSEEYDDVIQYVSTQGLKDLKEQEKTELIAKTIPSNTTNPVLAASSDELPNEFSIHHEFDKTDIIAEDQEQISLVIKKMNVDTNLKLEIISAADCYGDKQYNLNLSMRRAKYILSLFPSSMQNRIQMKWVGKDNPIQPCDEANLTIQGQTGNRYTILKLR